MKQDAYPDLSSLAHDDREAEIDTVEAMLREACTITGLSAFGEPTFRTGLDRFLLSLREDARLTPEGWADIRAVLLRRLSNRLRIEAWHGAHPEAASAPIEGPVSITGLPRTGTTALANMMSLDPQFRSLRLWEQAEPCPPPVLADESSDPRRLAWGRRVEGLAQAQPEQLAMHLYDVDATVEDHDLLGLEFCAQQTVVPAFGYHAWWRDADMRPAFHYHRRAITLLQSQRPPNRWLFKAPHHKFHLEALLDAYPDARFVFTHRDPAKAVPSFASFITSLYPRGVLARHDLATIGRELHRHLLIGMQRALAARARIGEHRFIDVHQSQIDRDPIGTLGRIYDFLGLELTDGMIAAVGDWARANHVGAYGVHRYTAEEFGLNAKAIRSDYSFYIDRFDVKVG